MITALQHRGATIGQPIQSSTAYINAAADRSFEERAMRADLDAVEISIKIFDENKDETLDARDAVISFTHLVDQYAAAPASQHGNESGSEKAISAYQATLNEQLQRDLSAAKEPQDKAAEQDGHDQSDQSVGLARPTTNNKTLDITV